MQLRTRASLLICFIVDHQSYFHYNQVFSLFCDTILVQVVLKVRFAKMPQNLKVQSSHDSYLLTNPLLGQFLQGIGEQTE